MPFAELADVRIAYEIHGVSQDDSGPDIVLIRGLGTQLIEWPEEFLKGLVAAGFRVVLMDNRDAGLSSKVEGASGAAAHNVAAYHLEAYTVEDMAADVVGLLDHVSSQRAHVFGISMGGVIAQHVALAYPERVASLISVMSSSGNPELPSMAPEHRHLLTRVAADVVQAVLFDAEEREIWGSPGYPISYSERLAASQRAADRCYCPEGVARQMRAVLGDGSRVARLAQLRVPTLVIHGREDSLIPAAAGIDTAACITGARLELVDGMGHNIPPGLGGTLATLVAQFVSGL